MCRPHLLIESFDHIGEFPYHSTVLTWWAYCAGLRLVPFVDANSRVFWESERNMRWFVFNIDTGASPLQVFSRHQQTQGDIRGWLGLYEYAVKMNGDDHDGWATRKETPHTAYTTSLEVYHKALLEEVYDHHSTLIGVYKYSSWFGPNAA